MLLLKTYTLILFICKYLLFKISIYQRFTRTCRTRPSGEKEAITLTTSTLQKAMTIELMAMTILCPRILSGTEVISILILHLKNESLRSCPSNVQGFNGDGHKKIQVPTSRTYILNTSQLQDPLQMPSTKEPNGPGERQIGTSCADIWRPKVDCCSSVDIVYTWSKQVD